MPANKPVKAEHQAQEDAEKKEKLSDRAQRHGGALLASAPTLLDVLKSRRSAAAEKPTSCCDS
jgi:hypothetical protein